MFSAEGFLNGNKFFPTPDFAKKKIEK